MLLLQHLNKHSSTFVFQLLLIRCGRLLGQGQPPGLGVRGRWELYLYGSLLHSATRLLQSFTEIKDWSRGIKVHPAAKQGREMLGCGVGWVGCWTVVPAPWTLFLLHSRAYW